MILENFTHITNKHRDLIGILHARGRLNDVVFCGSFGLLLNGYLDRPIGDIDILTKEDHYTGGQVDYHLLGDYRVSGTADSHKFMLGDTEVLSFKVRVGELNIDIFYTSNELEYDEVDLGKGITILVEKPQYAIENKKLYVRSNRRSSVKHKLDLDYMRDKVEVYKNKI